MSAPVGTRWPPYISYFRRFVVGEIPGFPFKTRSRIVDFLKSYNHLLYTAIVRPQIRLRGLKEKKGRAILEGLPPTSECNDKPLLAAITNVISSN
ncbi:hypothetical protein AB6A40_010210 [Gnathostoma spinigerum]|uniref:Uncharacterized protein n=1 Tax=Gnathostoma spinigerum TaxID=75299 RepID=A0ABD6F0P6_9BILA